MVDDATATYILENHTCFEDLQQVASQLAGLLVLAAAGSKEASPDHPALLRARELYREATEEMQRGQPTERARKHHEHLTKAAGMIGAALRQADATFDVERIL